MAARKLLPKRPVKPLKTFPRNNATPIPATGAGAGAGAVSGSVLNGSELPKPLTLQSGGGETAEAIVASPAATPAPASAVASASPASPPAAGSAETKAEELALATPSSGSSADEDCEPDMIGFELITG